jgi:hypothetical protein
MNKSFFQWISFFIVVLAFGLYFFVSPSVPVVPEPVEKSVSLPLCTQPIYRDGFWYCDIDDIVMSDGS